MDGVMVDTVPDGKDDLCAILLTRRQSVQFQHGPVFREKGWAEDDLPELELRAEQLGLTRLGGVVRKVVAGLKEKLASAKWQSRPTAKALLEVAVLARLAREVAG